MLPDREGGELLIVGDLHGHFDAQDIRFLDERRAELVVFVGDLGDEDPGLTERVCEVRAPKVVLLGNHDAWESFRHDAPSASLQQSLELLGDFHLAYRKIELPRLGVTLLGARPFSWGGPSLRSAPVYEELYGVTSMEDSAKRIADLALDAEHRDLVILAHNGPHGLGEKPTSIYGKDFGRPGGDWGDRDLSLAIQDLKKRGYRLPLVIGGHMHHRLHHPRGAKRQRFVQQDGTFYLNPARVPRIFQSKNGTTLRHYVSAVLEGGELLSIEELLADEQGVKAKRLG